jgi:L-lactate dehydrogenase complex protein LldG
VETDRDRILADVRRALASARAEGKRRGHGPAPATAARSVGGDSARESAATHAGEPTDADPITDFQSALDAVQGVCHRVTSDSGAAEVIQAIVADLEIRRVVRSDDEIVIDILEEVVGGFELLDPDRDRREMLECDLGISRATVGVAEHGTIVMTSGDAAGARGRGTERQRLVSLLPETHVALLAASDIVRTWDQALEGVGSERDRLPPTVTFATGPSRTADIELELVLGVHGPRNQHVIVLEHR